MSARTQTGTYVWGPQLPSTTHPLAFEWRDGDVLQPRRGLRLSR
ncbi:hypothetical protein [Streptomyces sp. NBC_00083]|nr:hypothetical protein [Streptomyces sp. NBC_00083]MCX5385866.1 hypothetical protein [Streptomyces sp. NBC_00083]